MNFWQSFRFEYSLARANGRGFIYSLVIAWQFSRLPMPF